MFRSLSILLLFTSISILPMDKELDPHALVTAKKAEYDAFVEETRLLLKDRASLTTSQIHERAITLEKMNHEMRNLQLQLLQEKGTSLEEFINKKENFSKPPTFKQENQSKNQSCILY